MAVLVAFGLLIVLLLAVIGWASLVEARRGNLDAAAAPRPPLAVAAAVAAPLLAVLFLATREGSLGLLNGGALALLGLAIGLLAWRTARSAAAA